MPSTEFDKLRERVRELEAEVSRLEHVVADLRQYERATRMLLSRGFWWRRSGDESDAVT